MLLVLAQVIQFSVPYLTMLLVLVTPCSVLDGRRLAVAMAQGHCWAECEYGMIGWSGCLRLATQASR